MSKDSVIKLFREHLLKLAGLNNYEEFEKILLGFDKGITVGYVKYMWFEFSLQKLLNDCGIKYKAYTGIF